MILWQFHPLNKSILQAKSLQIKCIKTILTLDTAWWEQNHKHSRLFLQFFSLQQHTVFFPLSVFSLICFPSEVNLFFSVWGWISFRLRSKPFHLWRKKTPLELWSVFAPVTRALFLRRSSLCHCELSRFVLSNEDKCADSQMPSQRSV